MSFTIDLNWPPLRAADSADVAQVRISAHDRLLTQLFDVRENQLRDHFRASAVGLAFWFADNWWRLRWEPLGHPQLASTDWRVRHELSSGSSNELWPPIMIYGVGPRVLIAPAIGQRQEEAGIRYLEDRPHSMSGQDYEDGVDHFLDQVLQRCAQHVDAAPLSRLISQLSVERDEPELAAWRRLEACLGFDPDQAPEGVVDAMVSLEDELGEEAIEEAAVAAQGAEAHRTLSLVLQATAESPLEVNFSALGAMANMPDPHGLTPWQAAEDAADHLRELLGLPDVISGHTLGDLLQTRWDDLKRATATARRLPYAGKAEIGGDRSRLALQMVPQMDRRFELARMVGDEPWSRGGGFGVVSRTRTDRQKYQRAFAQSLLCPMKALRRIVDLDNPTQSQIITAARRFDVREKVIMTILINRGYLPRETTADRLEAA